MFFKLIILTIKFYHYFYQLKWINLIILNFIPKWILSVFLQCCNNVEGTLKIMLFLNIGTMLWQHWKLMLFFNIATTLWQCCLNVVAWSDFNVGHQHLCSVAWTLSFGRNSTLDTNVGWMLCQCCDLTLWQRCKIMLFSNIVATLLQGYTNIVQMLLQHCGITFVINVVATL